MEYQNFDLRVEGKPGESYRVRVQSEGMDEVEGLLALSPDCQKIADALQQVETLQMGSSLPMDLGLMLHQCLFHDSVRDTMLLSLGGVFRDDEKGMRIRLMLAPPELAALPWEVLCDPTTKSYLSTSGKTPLIRYITSREPIKSLRVDSPVRVLVLIPDGSGLDVDKEEGIITAALKALDTVDIKVIKGNVTRSQIKQLLNEQQYHIIHFIGHGAFQDDQGYLVIDPDERNGKLISADDFADFFTDYPSLKLVVLNCCQGGQVSPKDKYAGMAAKLVATGMPAVVAMQYPISDDAALVFAREFYLKLCKGWSRGQVDMAISHARQRIYKEVKEPMAFATPVLFLRSDNSIIFDLEQASEQQGTTLRRLFSLFSSAPIKNRNRLEQVKQTRKKNIEAWQEKTKHADEEIRQEATDAIAEEQAEIKALDQRIVRWNRAFFASLCVTGLIFVLGYAGLFNVFHADDWLESRFIPYMDDFVVKRFNPSVRLIMSDEGANGELGTPGPAWRTYHADLIDALAGKAKVIVFDLKTPDPTSDDDKLVAAIKRADEKGTRVIMGKRVRDDGTVIADLAPALRAALDDRWGNIDVVGQHWGFVRVYQLAQAAGNQNSSGNSVARVSVPSLALQAVTHFLGGATQIDEKNEKIQLTNGAAIKSIPVYETNENVYDLPYGMVDYSQIKDATHSYQDVYSRIKDPNYFSQFKDTIVIIGYKTPEELFSIAHGQRLYGTEIHANVVSDILGDVYVRWLPAAYDLLIVAILAATGALVQARFSNVFTMGLFIPYTEPKKRISIPGLLFIADLLYLMAAFLFYKFGLIYILKTYHLFTPFIAYWLTGKMRRSVALRPTRGLSS